MRLITFALAALATLVIYSQPKFTVIDTLHHDGVTYELGLTSLAALDINMKRDSYLDIVKSAQKTGWDLCPGDSMSIKRIAAKVHLDPDNYKFSAYIATTPFTLPEAWRRDNAFWIHEISSHSGEPGYGLYREAVGYFGTKDFPEPFPALFEVMTPGYWSIDVKAVMYDWLFARKVANANP